MSLTLIGMSALEYDTAGVLRGGPCDGRKLNLVAAGTEDIVMGPLVNRNAAHEDERITYGHYRFLGLDDVDDELRAVFRYVGQRRSQDGPNDPGIV